MCARVCTCTTPHPHPRVHAAEHTCRSEGNFTELILFFTTFLWALESKLRLSGWHSEPIYLMSHLTNQRSLGLATSTFMH